MSGSRRTVVRHTLGISTSGLGAVAIALMLAACFHADGEESPTSTKDQFQRGGTLRMATSPGGFAVFADFDPQKAYFGTTWELYRCCLLRTLLSFPGKRTGEGAAVMRPDLAAAMPRVSSDGLTWTFRLKRGIRYAPPFEDTTIRAQDFIRALEREANPKASTGGYSFYYSVIEGFDEVFKGNADSISGLEAPDDTTLVVHLSQPAGDLGARFSMPATAPIPPGAAEGHDSDYGRFLVASGPYMLEGSEKLDFAKPPKQQTPVPGYAPDKSVTLVRNPSWDPGDDALRAAYVDRIQLMIGGTVEENASKVDTGQVDLVFDLGSGAPSRQVRRYQADDDLKRRVFVDRGPFSAFISMNLAVPPFDDLHVRKAMNLVIDKESLRRLIAIRPSSVFGQLRGQIAGHIVPDSLESNLLLDYDPYATPRHKGDLARARKEMSESKYDRDGDGVCDSPVCKRVRAVGRSDAGFPEMTAVIQRDLRGIGITLKVETSDPVTMTRKLWTATERVPLGLGPGWGYDYLNASTFFVPLFYGPAVSGVPAMNNNVSLLGAAPDQLRRWGYRVGSVPSIDDKIEECLPVLGVAQARCWAEADQLLMEKVVPLVPYLFLTYVRTVSARVARYSFSQATGLPALDQIALKR
jgi:ABC-type transport system substrate-binding protein